MNIEIVKLRNFLGNPASIDLAFPIIAIECEAYIPQENEIDAYQEAVLKLVSIGLAENGIRNTLDITQSLCGDIFNTLKDRNFLSKENGKWELTEKAAKALYNTNANEISDTSRFGYMFLSAIKKDPFWFFYEGDIHTLPLADKSLLYNKLTIANNENTTFTDINISKWRIEKAYSIYCKIAKAQKKKEKGAIDEEEYEALFTEIESDFTEVEYIAPINQPKEEVFEYNEAENEEFKIRRLNREPLQYYLQMRIVFDPMFPGGYKAESPLDFNGYDNDFFLRQIQWMENPSQNIYLGPKKMHDVIKGEINKLSVNPINSANINVFMLKNFPALEGRKEKYSKMFRDVNDIFGLMNIPNPSIILLENIIGSINKNIIETLMNKFINSIPEMQKYHIMKRALYDFDSFKIQMVRRFSDIISVDMSILPQDGKIYYDSVKRLKYSGGNSIQEKLINFIVIHYYNSTKQLRALFKNSVIEEIITSIQQLNSIRNKAIHKTEQEITQKEYDYYIEHSFEIANILLKTLEEAE